MNMLGRTRYLRAEAFEGHDTSDACEAQFRRFMRVHHSGVSLLMEKEEKYKQAHVVLLDP